MPECQRSLQTHSILPARRRANATKTHPATTWSPLVCLLPPTRYVHLFFSSSIKTVDIQHLRVWLLSGVMKPGPAQSSGIGDHLKPCSSAQAQSSGTSFFFLHVLTSPFSQKTTTQLSCNCQVTKTTVLSTRPSALKSRLYPMMTMMTLGAEELTEKTSKQKKTNHTREAVGLENISMWDAHLNPRTHVVSALFFQLSNMFRLKGD